MTKVIINGTFDIVHLGHLHLLQYARSFPDSYVYVLIDGDDRVKLLKGQDRPINNEYERKFLLESLKFVDRVDLFYSDEELEELIKAYDPDVMVKGSDYKNRPIIGADYCKKIAFYDYISGYSTTKKIQSIVDR